MKLILLLASCVVAAMPAYVQASMISGEQPDELSQRAATSDLGRNLLLQGKSEEMESRYREMVAHSDRTSSGLWKSGLFLSGIQDMFIHKPESEAHWSRIEAISDAWIKQEPQSIVAKFVHLELLRRRAWSIRGSDYASDVPESAWAPFKATLNRAWDYLESEKPALVAYPDYYAMCIAIAKGLDDGISERAMGCLDQGTRKFPDYYPMYFEMLDYLLPKWHGNASAVERFAAGVVEKTREVEGEGMYARIYWYAAQAEYGNALFASSSARWEQMRAGFDDIVSRYPDEWNIQNYAKFACLAGDMDRFKKERARMKKPPMPRAWGNEDGLFARCQNASGEQQI